MDTLKEVQRGQKDRSCIITVRILSVLEPSRSPVLRIHTESLPFCLKSPKGLQHSEVVWFCSAPCKPVRQAAMSDVKDRLREQRPEVFGTKPFML